MRSSPWAVLVFAAMTMCATVGRAQSSPSEAERHRTLFERGNQLFDQQKLEEAEAAYLEAFRLKRTFDVAGNLGNVQADLKKWRAAAQHLAFALGELPAGAKPGTRQALSARLADVEKEVGKLTVRADAANTEILLDGVALGRAPLADAVYVDPGPHVVEGRLAGYAPTRVAITIAKAEARDVDLSLPPEGPRRGWLIGGGVTTGVVAIAGAALAGASAAKRSQASSLASSVPKSAPCPAGGVGATGACATLASELRTRTALGNASIASFAAAGALGVATLAYALAASPRAPSAGVRLSPWIGPHVAAISLGGAY